MGRRPAPSSLRELEIRGEALAGHTVAELARALDVDLPSVPTRAKGFVGQLVELALGADPQAFDGPDFSSLEVELKTLPLNAQGLPAESTFDCSIEMDTADVEEWQTSRLRRRLQRVLWVPVEGAKLASLPERRLGRPWLWAPTDLEEARLRADWEHLMGAIGAGRGGELSAHEGEVLQVRPKAMNASVRTLGFGPEGPAPLLPLGFYLRTSFTAQLLRGRNLFPVGDAC